MPKLETQFELVEKPQQVADNITFFEREVHGSIELQSRLSLVHAWYAHRNAEGQWIFGNSKFVGYNKLSVSNYLKYSQSLLDGRLTEDRLNKWFIEIDPASEFHAELYQELRMFLRKFAKLPRAKVRIYVTDEQHEENFEKITLKRDANPIVDLIIEVSKTLSAKDLRALRAKIAA